MKTVSDDLFRLIKSLTKSEKGYFKKFAARNTPGEKNNYVVLFDAVEKMESYDEDELRTKLEKTSFISQLPVYKNYLFNLILKSLQSYSAYESVDTKLTELIQNAKTLEKKAFHKEALRVLKKAKAIAVKYENNKALLEILDFERVILMIMPDKNIYEKRLEHYKHQQELLDTLQRNFYYAWLSDRMVMYVEHKGDFRSEKVAKDIQKILSDPFVKNPKNAKDYTSKRFFLHILLFNELSKDDLNMILYYVKKEIELINEYKHMIDVNARSYIHMLVNYLMFSNILKNKSNVRDAIIKINELKRRLKNKIPLELEITILVDTCYAEIAIHRNNADLRKGRITAGRIEDILVKYKHEISMEIKVVLILNTALFYMLDLNYTGALKLINALLNEIPPSFKKNQYDFARLFQLILHFELGNYDVLENSVDSVYRFLRERGSIFKIEAALFSFLKEALRTERSKLKPLFEELLYEMEKASDEPESRATLGTFNFIRWAKSKIENKSLVELIESGD